MGKKFAPLGGEKTSPLFRSLLLTIFGLGLFLPSLDAEIFADFTIAHGDNELGSFRVLLHANRTPRTVANFVGLATGQRPWLNPVTNRLMTDTPFYDGLVFHRLIHNFVLQGGRSTGDRKWRPGICFSG